MFMLGAKICAEQKILKRKRLKVNRKLVILDFLRGYVADRPLVEQCRFFYRL